MVYLTFPISALLAPLTIWVILSLEIQINLADDLTYVLVSGAVGGIVGAIFQSLVSNEKRKDDPLLYIAVGLAGGAFGMLVLGGPGIIPIPFVTQ